MIRQICIVLVLSLLFAGVAEAQSYTGASRAETWDFLLMTRYSWSQNVTSDNGASVDLGDDLGWGFGFGYNYKTSLRQEVDGTIGRGILLDNQGKFRLPCAGQVPHSRFRDLNEMSPEPTT